MKKIFTFFLFAVSVNVHGQGNLVPNPSFEQYSSCPDGNGEVNRATNWNAFNTADYFNICATSSDIQVPENYFGYQQPATGNGYCGFFTYYGGFDYHEFIYAQLITPLIVNQKYFVSFKVSPSDSSYCIYSNKTGIKFFTSFPLNVFPNNTDQFHTNVIITDTAGWTRLYGSFIADSVYKYAVIGNFFSDANTDIIDHNCGLPFSYYFIDDVCVSTDSLSCNSVLPINLLSFNVRGIKNTIQLNWYTSQELNNKGFEILRSEGNADNFKKIGFVNGASYSTTERQYGFIDNDLRNNIEYFYKLRQIDFDGKFSYSSIQRGEIAKTEKDFFINPNPVNDRLSIYFTIPLNRECIVSIKDNSGKTVAVYRIPKVAANQSTDIPMHNCAAGLYFVQVITGDHISTATFLKR